MIMLSQKKKRKKNPAQVIGEIEKIGYENGHPLYRILHILEPIITQ